VKEVNPMQKRQHYLVATDGSAGGDDAVREAIEFARASGALLSIVYIRQAPLPVLGDPFYQRALSEELVRARSVVDDAAAQAAAADIDTQVDVLEGSAAPRIIELARHRDVDMIILGSRGRGAVAGTLLGSVSEAVVHKADRPVLVVRPRARVMRHAA
jgi:nucleotide-binding universal stress UspA family protein